MREQPFPPDEHPANPRDQVRRDVDLAILSALAVQGNPILFARDLDVRVEDLKGLRGSGSP